MCVQNVMYVILATVSQFSFCYVLKIIIISSVHGAFSLSINVHVQNTETPTFLLRK